jgi:hypothetical protein
MTPKEAYRKCIKENSRTPELEKLIATDPNYSYLYAVNIIKEPWEKGEKSISKDPYCSYLYTLYVIKRPFEKSHPLIFNSEYKDEYLNFLKSFNYDMNKISEWML